MFKLLVNSPSGLQNIELIESTGKYFDPERVLWDERVRGDLPKDIEVGRMELVGGKLVKRADLIPDHAAIVQESNQKNINKKTADLWAAADAYIYATINGVALSILALGVSQSKPKALAVAAWCDSVWAEYYARKAGISVDSDPNLDFSSMGDKPYSVIELKDEVADAWGRAS